MNLPEAALPMNPLKIETDDNTGFTLVLIVALFCLATILVNYRYQVETTKREAFKAGLHEVQLEGSQATRLAKP